MKKVTAKSCHIGLNKLLWVWCLEVNLFIRWGISAPLWTCRSMLKYWGHPQKICPSCKSRSISSFDLLRKNLLLENFWVPLKKNFPISIVTRNRNLREIWTNPCGAYVSCWGRNQVKRSSLLKVNKKITKKPTEADIGCLRISLLRI